MLQHGRPGAKWFWWPKKYELDSSCITDGGNIPGKDSFIPTKFQGNLKIKNVITQAAAGSVQKQDGAWVGVVAGGGGGVNAVQVYYPMENKW